MKRIYSFLALGFIAAAISCTDSKKPGVPDNAINPDVMKNPATASSSSDKTKVPKMEFENETHDFGAITQGEKVTYEFQFKNTGDGDLLIRTASGSCGCTVPEWPKDPVHPGQKGTIKVTFDSAGKTGSQHKTVTIISNTVPNTKVINITATILTPEEK
jgi:hypothetical protein